MMLSIIIPCYNEADNLAKIQNELFPIVRTLAQSQDVEVVVVDDGSRDGTGTLFSDALGVQRCPGVEVRFGRHAINLGLGAALRTGFAMAQGDVILTTDSDGTYSFSELPALLACLTGDVDIVTASPYHPSGGVEDVPGYRLLFSRGASLLYRLLVDPKVHTYTSLFRAYRRRVIESVPFQSDGFLAGTELMVKAMLWGFRVAEYPTVLHSRVSGISKAKLARTTRAHLAFQMGILLYRLNLPSTQFHPLTGNQE